MTTQLLAAAQAVLFGKKEETIPAQSNWDRAWMAMAGAPYDLEYAGDLFRHIFNRQHSSGALHWAADQQVPSGAKLSEQKVLVSKAAVEQPEAKIILAPVYGFALWHIYEAAKDQKAARRLLKEFYPKVMAFHRFLYNHRDPLDEGLLIAQHPWEMGRFTNATSTSVQVQDPFFNGMLTYSNECLIKIGSLLKTDFLEAMDWHELTIYSMNDKLWDHDRSIYNAYDVQSDEPIPYHNIYGLIPMLGEVPTQEQAEAMLLLLESEHFGGSREDHFFCPTHSLLQQPTAKINPLLNWMLKLGLERYDMYELADRVGQDTLELMEQSGFKSYYGTQKDAVGNRLEKELNADSIAAAVSLLLFH